MGRKKIPTSQGERTSSSADDDAVAHASLLKKKARMAFSKRTADHLADQIRKGEVSVSYLLHVVLFIINISFLILDFV